MPRLEKISQDILAQPTYGYLSLFSDRRLTLKCVLITATLFGIGFTYSNLTLNIGNMGGNIFVNFFLLAVVDTFLTFFDENSILVRGLFGVRYAPKKKRSPQKTFKKFFYKHLTS